MLIILLEYVFNLTLVLVILSIVHRFSRKGTFLKCKNLRELKGVVVVLCCCSGHGSGMFLYRSWFTWCLTNFLLEWISGLTRSSRTEPSAIRWWSISTEKFVKFMDQRHCAKERCRNGSENLRTAVKISMMNLAQANGQLSWRVRFLLLMQKFKVEDWQ